MVSEYSNAQILDRYGSVPAVLERLNQLGSQKALAEEVGVAESTVGWFLRAHRVERRVVWALPGQEQGVSA